MNNVYSYHVRHRNGWGRSFGPAPTHCADCGATLPAKPDTGAAGYGTEGAVSVAPCLLPGAPAAPQWFLDAQAGLKPGESLERSRAVCYACCGRKDEQSMRETGRAVLYLEKRGDAWQVTNWPGSLVIHPFRITQGRHNIGRTRTDAWFSFEGQPWHGINIGDNQILRCKRLKGKNHG